LSQPFIGEIRMFGGNFAPNGWAFCSGQLMAISQNDTLFNLIGTTYGGDGQETFALPDLQGRVPIHQGSGFVIGQLAGSESVTLTSNQLPPHVHTVNVGGSASTNSPSGARLASTATGSEIYAPTPGTLVQAAGQEIPSSGGGNQPHENMMPFLTVNFIISLFGIFPSQN
jgi:microcystin-dependent protein